MQGFGVPRPVAGIYDMYGPCQFESPFWTTKLEPLLSKLPKDLSEEFISQVYAESPVPITGGVSLEGQSPGAPNFSQPRVAFAFTQIANGRVMDVIMPSKEWEKVDPVLNISPSFPPTVIAHGDQDNMVPMDLSKALLKVLGENKVKCEMIEVPGEGHTFAGAMKFGSQTWEVQKKGFDFLESLIS